MKLPCVALWRFWMQICSNDPRKWRGSEVLGVFCWLLGKQTAARRRFFFLLSFILLSAFLVCSGLTFERTEEPVLCVPLQNGKLWPLSLFSVLRSRSSCRSSSRTWTPLWRRSSSSTNTSSPPSRGTALTTSSSSWEVKPPGGAPRQMWRLNIKEKCPPQTNARCSQQEVTQLFPVSTAREAAMWELEERHLQEKHQLFKQQLKDQYFMQRHQLLKRHEKVELREEKHRPEGLVCVSGIQISRKSLKQNFITLFRRGWSFSITFKTQNRLENSTDV